MRARRRAGAVCAAAGLALYGIGAGAEVEFAPTVEAGIAHTDNVTLAAENEESETVYQLIPSFDLVQGSNRFESTVAYRMQVFYYGDRSDTEIYHSLNSQLSAALDPQNFFIDVGANRSQSIRDPQMAIPRSNLPLTGNRIDRDEAFAGPRFQYPLGANVTANGSYRRSWVRYDDRDTGNVGGFARDVDQDTVSFSLDNYRRERGVTWALRYDSQESDYGLFLPWEYRRAAAELGGWAGGGVRLFASGGKESAWDQPFDASLEDDFWEVGFAKTAGESFSAEFAAGERTFGSSRRGNLQWTFRRGSTRFSYVEEPTTQERNPYDRGGLLLPDEPEDYLSQPGAAERFLSKRLQWSLQFDFRRSGFDLRLFDEDREERTRLDGTVLPDESQTGAYLSAYWELGARTRLIFDARDVERSFGGDDRQFESAAVGARRDLGPRSMLTFEYEHAKEDTDSGAPGSQYAANVVSVLFTLNF